MTDEVGMDGRTKTGAVRWGVRAGLAGVVTLAGLAGALPGPSVWASARGEAPRLPLAEVVDASHASKEQGLLPAGIRPGVAGTLGGAVSVGRRAARAGRRA